jgi:hypothetical protein
LSARSVSTESSTNCSATCGRFAAVMTKFFIDRHVWHQGAHRSTKMGLPCARAAASAGSGRSSYQGRPCRMTGPCIPVLLGAVAFWEAPAAPSRGLTLPRSEQPVSAAETPRTATTRRSACQARNPLCIRLWLSRSKLGWLEPRSSRARRLPSSSGRARPDAQRLRCANPSDARS